MSYEEAYSDWQNANQDPNSDFVSQNPGYLAQLQNLYKTKYGMDASSPFSYKEDSPADQLLGLSGTAKTLQAKDVLQTNNFADDPMRGMHALAQAKTYDPSAHMDDFGTLIFDKSKLPQWSGGNDFDAFKKYGGLASLSEDHAKDRVLDPNYVIGDKNYGDYTLRGNLKASDSDTMDPFWKYTNMAAHTIANMATGGWAGLIDTAGNYLSNATETGNWKGGLGNLGMQVAANYVPGGQAALSMYNLSQQMKKYKKRS